MMPGGDNLAIIGGVVGGIVASAFALLRLTLHQQRGLTDRFLSFLEASLGRQEKAAAEFQSTIDALDASVRENTKVLRTLVERMS